MYSSGIRPLFDERICILVHGVMKWSSGQNIFLSRHRGRWVLCIFRCLSDGSSSASGKYIWEVGGPTRNEAGGERIWSVIFLRMVLVCTDVILVR